MGHWSTSSLHETAASAEAVWSAAYADAAAWPEWNTELATARLDGELRAGAVAKVRFKTGLRLRFKVTELEPGRLFTDEACLPGARLAHRHELQPLDGGGCRLLNTISIDGPLSGLWAALAGRRAARALPSGQRIASAMAGGAMRDGSARDGRGAEGRTGGEARAR